VAQCHVLKWGTIYLQQVTLQVTSPDEVVSVSVIDGLPAGLEALDSAIYPNQPAVDGPAMPAGGWWWWWFSPFQVYPR
jgi:hypothetical protein